MKKINEKFKNLFLKEYNKDLLKVIATIFSYLIIVSIFRAGYEFRNFNQISKSPEKPKVIEYKYYITYKNDRDQYNFNEAKDLYSLITNIPGIKIDATEYYEGTEITAINGNEDYIVKVNEIEVTSKFFSNKDLNLESGTKIEIIY